MTSKKLMIMPLLVCCMSLTAMKRSPQDMLVGEPAAKRIRVWDTVLEGTPLHDAYNKADLLEFWFALESGADANEIKRGDEIIITTQINTKFDEKEREVAFKLLVSHGANAAGATTFFSGMDLGHIFASQGNSKMLEKALSIHPVHQRIDVNHEDIDGNTPIFYARTVDVLNVLYQAGAQLDYRNDKRRTLLHDIAENNNQDIHLAELCVKLNPLLIQHKDSRGETAFQRQDRLFRKHPRTFKSANPVLENSQTVRPIIVAGDNGVFAKKNIGNPLEFVNNRQMGATRFNAKQISR